MNKKDLISIRDFNKDDMTFINSTWIKGVRFGNSWFEAIDEEIYNYYYPQVIQKLLLRQETKIKIACLKEDETIILGYSVFEGDVLHWVFCKTVWRNIGIARDLIPREVKYVTHLTKPGVGILKKHPEIKFNPFLV